MGSTIRTNAKQADAESSASAAIRWRSWPLADYPGWSWLMLVGTLSTGIAVWRLGGWLLAVAAIAALALALWQFLLPVVYEVCSLGIRRHALGRTRLVPWQAVHAYELRSTGVVLYQRDDPMWVDLLRSLFVPYPPDADEMLCAVRQFLSHATELSR